MKVIVMAQTVEYLFKKGKPIYHQDIERQEDTYLVLK